MGPKARSAVQGSFRETETFETHRMHPIWRVKPPLNKGPPRTIDGTFFLRPRGWTSFRAVVEVLLPLFPSNFLRKGDGIYLDRFLGGGARCGFPFGHGLNEGTVFLLGGLQGKRIPPDAG